MASPTTTEAEEPDDWHLAGEARAGDESAYASLIERHQGAIHAFIYRHINDAETARDLAQEVFVKAWFALGRARPKAQFTTWLFQIAINLCRDEAKSKTFRQGQITDSIVRESFTAGEYERDLPDHAAAPDEAVAGSETARLLDSEIARLPADLREAFLLGAVDGWRHKEIAAALGITPKTVEVRIYRARKILTERLSARGLIDEFLS
ncbi:MAG: RNA polymerase sigma factor [Chthoniobacterales bacterium]